MSEKREKKREVVSIHHFCHPHPLTLCVFGTRSEDCLVCDNIIHSEETVYVCREGCYDSTLHEECAEMPREIKLLMHPQHTLIHKQVPYYTKNCVVCEKAIYRFAYACVSSEPCGFQVHIRCAQNMEVLQGRITHPSHPQHQITMLGRPGRSYSIRCDACGTVERGNSYICIICQYWIHNRCAELSATTHFLHHHHPLSLAYQLPLEYNKYDFKCDICLKAFLPRYWVYHCEDCRYVVHIKCAINTTTTNIDADAAEDEGVIVFPLKNGVEELIASFVTKEGGVMPNIPDDKIVNGKYKFHNHDHQLHLVSSPSSLHPLEEEYEDEDEEEVEVEENSDDDVDDFNKSELMCDGCTTPIFPNQQKSSQHKYLSCGECKYLLHWTCFHLPPQIPSTPLHPRTDHNLTLQTRPKLDFVNCEICWTITNGLFYGCTKCNFRVDIKCASLPYTIKHKSHSRHHLKLLIVESLATYFVRPCNACGSFRVTGAYYVCDACKIYLHSSCALLPAFVTNHRWDKHPLPLTFDASVNHSSSFCCDICEEEMNPKRWMYHCLTYDFSVHPKCFPIDSGRYQNIKFGQQYDVASVHHHPLAYQLLTKKLYCDVCGQRKDYGCQGFQCTSDKCEFFMCLDRCAKDRKAEMKVVN